MKTKILDLIDFKKVDILLEGFNKSTGFVTAILDLEGNVLSKSGWRQICTEFHRGNPETSKKCTISDTVLSGKMEEGEKYHFYQCLNGLVDVAVPIVIKGEHIANLFSGQFFFEEPDSAYFKKQAEKYGFNEETYLKALGKVPVVSKEKVLVAMDFLLNMTQLISDMTFQKLEQLELNETIRKNERILRLFVEHSPASIAMFDNNMRYMVASRRFLLDYNLGSQDIIGRSHYEVFPEISERWKEIHRCCLSGETISESNDPFPRADGTTDWVRWEIRPWYESENQIGGIILFSEVITTQVEAREALKDSEEKYRLIAENANDWVYWIDENGNFKYVSPSCEAITGYSPDDFMNNSHLFQTIVHNADKQSIQQHLANVNTIVTNENLIFRIICKTGEEKWISHTCAPIFDSGNNFKGRSGTNREITAQRRVELELSESEKYNRMLFEQSPIGLALNSMDGKLVDVNSTFANIIGRTIEEAKELTYWDITPSIKYQEQEQHQLDLLAKTGRYGPYEKEYIHKDGHLVPVRLQGLIIERNNEKYIWSSVEDISEQKKTEQDLIAAKEEIEASERIKSDLLIKFNEAQQSAKIGNWDWDMVTNKVWWSDELYRIFDLDPTTFVPSVESNAKFVHPDDNDPYHKEVQRVIVNKEELNADLRIISGKGSLKYCNSKAKLEFDENGNPVRFYGTFADITDRKLAQESLHESEKKYRHLFENNPLPMWIYDLQTLNFLEVNEAAILHYGYSKQEFLSMTLKDIRPDDEITRLLNDVDRNYSSYNKAGIWKHKKKNGSIIFVEIISHLIEFESTSARLVLAIDVTEKLKAEESLHETNEYLENLFNYANAPIIVWDNSFLITRFNHAFELLSGYTSQEVIGEKIDILFPKDKIQSSLQLIEKTTSGERWETIEIEILRKDQTVRTVLWNSANILDSNNGQIVATIAQGHDITERQLAEKLLQQSEVRLSKIFHSSPSAIVVSRFSDGRFIDLNEAAFKIYGYDREEIIGHTSIEMGIIDADERIKLVNALQSDGFLRNREVIVHSRNQGDRFVLYSMDILNIDGEKCMLTSMIDITELKQAEEKIKESSTLIRIAAEKAKLGGWNVILNENRSYWSDEVAAIHEMPPGYAPLVEDGINFYAPEWRERIIKVFTDCAQNGVPYDEEMEILTSTGKSVWVRTIGEAVRDENGKIFKVEGAFQDISERKLAEEKSREKDLQFRKLSANVPDLIFQFTRRPNGTYCVPVASDGIRNIFGCSPEDVVDDFTPISKVIYPDDAERVIADIENSAKNLTHFTCEFRVQIPGKPVQWILSRSTPEKLPDGNITWYGFNADITQRKEFEDSLRESEGKFRKIYEEGPFGMALVNSSFKFIMVNRTFCDLTGYTESELRELTFRDISYPEDKDIGVESVKKLIKGEIPVFRSEKRYVRKDGQVIWGAITVTAHFDKNGNFLYNVSIVEDITGRKQAAEKINMLNERLQLLVEAIQELSISTSLENIMKSVRTSARKLVNAEGTTFILRDGDSCFYADEDTISPLWKGQRFSLTNCISGWAMLNKQPVIIEDIYADERVPIEAYRSTFVKSLAIAPIRLNDPLGAIGAYWGRNYLPSEIEIKLLNTLADAAAKAVENVQLIEGLEQKISERTSQLQAVNKELETFTYSVSHDLKAPLRGIDGYSKLLSDLYANELNDEAKHFISTIRKSTQLMSQLIDDLLQYSRLERSQLRSEPVLIKPFINAILKVNEDEITAYRFSVITDIPETAIIADYNGIQMALRNLIENAIKFTKTVPAPTIEIKQEESERCWTISVKDNGIGFDMKYSQRIFEIFQRLHRVEDYPGTGIGLAMVGKAMQRMNGRAWAESTPGQGATFYLEIPKPI